MRRPERQPAPHEVVKGAKRKLPHEVAVDKVSEAIHQNSRRRDIEMDSMGWVDSDPFYDRFDDDGHPK